MTNYCPECGTSVESGAKFCKECGNKLPQESTASTETVGDETSESTKNEQATSTNVSNTPDANVQESGTNQIEETAPCQKCNTEIATEAVRCPQCGYEPSSIGTGLSLLNGISVIIEGLLALILVVTWVTVAGTDLGLSDALLVTVFLLFLLAFPAAIIYAVANKERKLPTGEKLDWDEV